MSQILYEQYKDALRRGHVAALRDHLEAAVAAYEAAATIAPDRALPYASLGAVLRRQGRFAEAEAAYAAALQRAPGDETALRGRAELRVQIGHRLEAAGDFEALADTLERGGRLTDACDAARRALELAESRARRRTVERLTALLREQDADPTSAEALRLAMELLEPAGPPSTGADDVGVASGIDDRPADAPAGTLTAPSGEAPAAPGAPAKDAAAEPAAAEPEIDLAAELVAAESMLDARDVAGARASLLAIAALQRGLGRLDAALDACLVLMAIDPSDSELQLEIAANQLARGWSALATEKVRLLERLAELNGDTEGLANLAAFATRNGLVAAEASADPASPAGASGPA